MKEAKEHQEKLATKSYSQLLKIMKEAKDYREKLVIKRYPHLLKSMKSIKFRNIEHMRAWLLIQMLEHSEDATLAEVLTHND